MLISIVLVRGLSFIYTLFDFDILESLLCLLPYWYICTYKGRLIWEYFFFLYQIIRLGLIVGTKFDIFADFFNLTEFLFFLMLHDLFFRSELMNLVLDKRTQFLFLSVVLFWVLMFPKFLLRVLIYGVDFIVGGVFQEGTLIVAFSLWMLNDCILFYLFGGWLILLWG